MIDLQALRNHAIELKKQIIWAESAASARTRRESDFLYERAQSLKVIHRFLVTALEEEEQSQA